VPIAARRLTGCAPATGRGAEPVRRPASHSAAPQRATGTGCRSTSTASAPARCTSTPAWTSRPTRTPSRRPMPLTAKGTSVARS